MPTAYASSSCCAQLRSRKSFRFETGIAGKASRLLVAQAQPLPSCEGAWGALQGMFQAGIMGLRCAGKKELERARTYNTAGSFLPTPSLTYSSHAPKCTVEDVHHRLSAAKEKLAWRRACKRAVLIGSQYEAAPREIQALASTSCWCLTLDIDSRYNTVHIQQAARPSKFQILGHV